MIAKTTKRISLYVTETLYNDIQDISEINARPMNQIIIKAIENYIEEVNDGSERT